MNDILGRELHDGDMAVGMAIGRHSTGMHIGVIQGSSVCRLVKSYNEDREYISKSCTSNIYLIENPTEQELELKNRINELLQEEADERERKATMKTIPLSKLEVGGIYKTTQGQTYMYLGKRKVTLEDFEERNRNVSEGNCFAYIYSFEDKTDDAIIDSVLSINTYKHSHNIDILKSNKKLTELIRKVNLEFPLVKEENNNKYSSCAYWRNGMFKLTVE